jgi:polysaccharide export outer membrane protein
VAVVSSANGAHTVMRLPLVGVGVVKKLPTLRAPHAFGRPLRRELAAVATITAGVLLAGSSLGLAPGLMSGARAQSASPMLAPDSVVSQNAYILGPGDQLQLTLLDPGVANLSGSFEILNDGSASLALLGSVVLEGLTVNQATSWLQSLYGRYLLRPDLNLRVVRPRPMQVSLVGEVESPGLYSLTNSEVSQTEGASTSIAGLPTVVTAIQKAGGLTLNADLTNVRLQRRLPGDSQQLRETKLDLAALLQLGDKYQNPFLFDGDTIVVGKAITPDAEVMELAAANLSPQTIAVNVVGQVVTPGRLQLPANTPLVQAVLAAGGPQTWRANRGNVELVRINRNGTATREIFSINYSQGVSRASNPPLRNGDTVIVNRSTFAVVTDALDAITQPAANLVDAWGLVRLIQGTYN